MMTLEASFDNLQKLCLFAISRKLISELSNSRHKSLHAELGLTVGWLNFLAFIVQPDHRLSTGHDWRATACGG